MMKKLASALVLLLLVSLCSPSLAGNKKIFAALIDFSDETPNKMILTPGEKIERDNIYLDEVMKIIRELTEKSGLFELLPNNTVTNAMNTDIGKEAAARRYDKFSAARLGKLLGVEAILIGEILQFEKNIIPKNFTINGLDFSNRVDDVVIRARLINAYNGTELADVTSTGNADENLLEALSAAITNKLSAGFYQATSISILRILRELESADIKIKKENAPIAHPLKVAETTNFIIVKTEGDSIYINAGRDKGVSIADVFIIMKNDSVGNLRPVANYSVSMVGSDSSRLVPIDPKGSPEKILVGDKVQRKTR